MNRVRRTCRRRDGERGQILVIAVIALIAMIGGVALVLEGGNAYAHQRVAQNGADAVANAGATVLAQRLGGGDQDDATSSPRRRRVADGERPRRSTSATTPTSPATC